jgi:hypothetical protein
MGSHDQITVAGWFNTSASSQLNKISTANGSTLDNAAVANLVQAMASYSGQTGFDPTSASQAPNEFNLQGAIAAAWH